MTALATETPTRAVTVPRSELARALRAASSIKAKNVLIDLTGAKPRIAGHTSAVGVEATLDVDAWGDGGSAFVPRVLLAGLLPYLGADVDLQIGEGQVTVTSGESTFEVLALRTAVDVVPESPKPNGTRQRRRARVSKPKAMYADAWGHDLAARGRPVASIEAPVLVEALRRTLPFASRDETRPVLATVALYPDVNTAAATDSYRLAVVRFGDENGEPSKPPVLIHVDAAVSLMRLLSKKLGKVTIRETKTHYLLGFEDTRWSIRRLHSNVPDEPAKYPRWWELLPDAKQITATVKVDRDDLLSAARAAAVVANWNSPLRLDVNPLTGVRVTSKGLDIGAMSRKLTTADATGEAHEIGLNPGFLAIACDVAPVERLTLHLISTLRPLLIEAARDQYLLMPIRLNV